MPQIKKSTNKIQSTQTGIDYYNPSPVLKDVLHIVTSSEETNKVINTTFKYTVGNNSLEVYVNGQLKRVIETIDGVDYGDYTETTNTSITFQSGVILEGYQIRFRVTANSYDFSSFNNNNIEQIARTLYGRNISGLLNNDGIPYGITEVNCLTYGDNFNSTTINAAISDIGFANKTLILPIGNWVMNANITIPANITLKIPMGSYITTTGYTLTINGKLECGLYQCFYGSGTVTLAKNSIMYVTSLWFGLSSISSGIQSSLPNECFYIGTSGKLIFKDSSGTEHDLY